MSEEQKNSSNFKGFKILMRFKLPQLIALLNEFMKCCELEE